MCRNQSFDQTKKKQSNILTNPNSSKLRTFLCVLEFSFCGMFATDWTYSHVQNTKDSETWVTIFFLFRPVPKFCFPDSCVSSCNASHHHPVHVFLLVFSIFGLRFFRLCTWFWISISHWIWIFGSFVCQSWFGFFGGKKCENC